MAGIGLLQRIFALGGKVDEADLSFDQRRQTLQSALNPKKADGRESGPWRWVRDVYDDFVVYEEAGDTYKRTYTIDSTTNAVTLGDPVKVTQVITYEPVQKATEATTPTNDTTLLIESVAMPLAEKAVRRDGTFDMLVIKPGWGSSGYYSKEMLKRDGPRAFPKGTHMFTDHPTEAEDRARPERSIKDLGGVIESTPVFKEDGWGGPGLYADAKPIGTMDAKMLDSIAPHIGVSIRAHGKVKEGEAEGKKGPIIEELTQGHSVDFVTRAGAGGSVRSLIESARNTRPITETKTAREEPMANGDTKPTTPDAGADSAALAEAQRKTIEEQGRTIARLTEANAIRDAREYAATLLASDRKLPDVTKRRIVESVCGNPPMKDGALDRDAFKTIVENAAKTEREYLATLTGSGAVRGLGETVPAERKPEETAKAMTEAFKTLGLSEKEAAQAAAGRGN